MVIASRFQVVMVPGVAEAQKIFVQKKRSTSKKQQLTPPSWPAFTAT